VCVCVCVCASKYVCGGSMTAVPVCTRARKYVHTHSHTHTNTHAQTHRHTHTPPQPTFILGELPTRSQRRDAGHKLSHCIRLNGSKPRRGGGTLQVAPCESRMTKAAQPGPHTPCICMRQGHACRPACPLERPPPISGHIVLPFSTVHSLIMFANKATPAVQSAPLKGLHQY